MGDIILFPGTEAEKPPYRKGLFIIKPGESWPEGVDDYRDSLAIPGYYLLGWRMDLWGRFKDIPSWETYWLYTEGNRDFLMGWTRAPKERHAHMCEAYPGYTPGSRIGRERAIKRFSMDNTEYGVICRPDLLLEKKDYRPKLQEIV
jgi:hypothetical protein